MFRDSMFVPEFKRFRLDYPTTQHGLMQHNPEEYFDFFSSLLNSPEIKITGDITPSYSALTRNVYKQIIEGFARRNVECKVVFLIRDPLERCRSLTRMWRRNKENGEPVPSDNFLDPAKYYTTKHAEVLTRYDRTICELDASFDSRNVFIGIYEEMHEYKNVVKLSEFLNVDTNFDLARNMFNYTTNHDELSDDIRDRIVNHYEGVYHFIAARFPRAVELWGGYYRLDRPFLRPQSFDVWISTEEEYAKRVYCGWMAAQSKAEPRSLNSHGSPGSLWQAARTKLHLSMATLGDILKPSDNSRPAETRPVAYLLLCATIVTLRNFVDAPPFDEMNSLLQISFLGATMAWGGVMAAIAAFLFVVGFEFFLIEPVLTLGTHDSWGLTQLALGTLIAVGFGIGVNRLFGSGIDDASPEGYGPA